MWVFRNDAFVSLVQDRDMPDQLWARARVKGHLEAFFAGTIDPKDIIETVDADYRFRIVVEREFVVAVMRAAVDTINYDNFKKSIPQTAKGDRYHDALLKVWSAMHALQQREWAILLGQWRKRGKKKGPKA